MTAHRIITNSAPQDYRSGIQPMDEPASRVPLWVSLTLIVMVFGFTLWGAG